MGVDCSIAACLADLASAAGLLLAHPANTATAKIAVAKITISFFAFIFVLLLFIFFTAYTASFNAHLYRQLPMGDFHRGNWFSHNAISLLFVGFAGILYP
jgi:hypothetical protein